MNFINPIELLELQKEDIASINEARIKKAKEITFSKITPGHDRINYKGLLLTKEECEKAIAELENLSTLKFYYYLGSNKDLNDFLAGANEKLLESFKQESIFEDSEFVKFISPFFAPQYDKILLKAFTDLDEKKVKAILATKNLIDKQNLHRTYKSLSTELQNRIENFFQNCQNIDDKTLIYTNNDVYTIIDKTKQDFPVDLLNLLPHYFGKQIDTIVSIADKMQLYTWKNYKDARFGLMISEYFLKLNAETEFISKLKRHHEIFVKLVDEQVKMEKFPVLKSTIKLSRSLRRTFSKIGKKTITSQTALNIVNAISIDELNNIDLSATGELAAYLSEFRNEIALAIREIAISICNIYGDLDISMEIILKACDLRVSPENAKEIKSVFEELKKIRTENGEPGKPVLSPPSLFKVYGIGRAMYNKTIYVVIFSVPVFPLARYDCLRTNKGYLFFKKLDLHVWQIGWKLGLPILLLCLLLEIIL